jgi:hypothetical protein
MDNSFFEYLQRLEIFSFFSGYPLLYGVVIVLAGEIKKKNFPAEKITQLLPLGYALSGILFAGMLIKNFYPDYSWQNVQQNIYYPFLVCWAVISFLFIIPAFRKKIIYSLLHSIVFFLWLVKDLLQASDKSVIKNEMNIYSDSLLLQSGLFVFLLIFFLVYRRLKK